MRKRKKGPTQDRLESTSAMSGLKRAVELPWMAEVARCVHETPSGVKTSFKDGHVVELACCGHDIRPVHIIRAAVTQKKADRSSQPRRSENLVALSSVSKDDETSGVSRRLNTRVRLD